MMKLVISRINCGAVDTRGTLQGPRALLANGQNACYDVYFLFIVFYTPNYSCTIILKRTVYSSLCSFDVSGSYLFDLPF